MGFRENLKSQLQYSGILVKDLAVRTGIKKPTLNSYLREDGYTPSVENGVKIAQALNVTAEYLVCGQDLEKTTLYSLLRPETQAFLTLFEQLGKSNRDTLLEIAKILKKKESV